MTPQLIAAIIILITLIVDAVTDLNRWDQGRINHGRGAAIRLLVLIGCLFIDWHSICLWIPYGIIFDICLNLGRKLRVLYVGETAWIDRLQRRYPFLIWLKYGAGVASIIIYIWL